MKNSKDFFNHFVQARSTFIGDKLSIYTFRRLFESLNVKPSDKVLEIGAGHGDFAKICIEHGAKYWAIEPNEEMACSLEQQGIKVIRCIIPPVPALTEKFDIVVMIDVMEHMDTMTGALDIAKSVYSLLEKNGKFLICSPDYQSFGKYFYLIDFSHNYITSYRRLHQLLVNAGFKTIFGYHYSGPFKGLLCFLISGLVHYLPFAWLSLAIRSSNGFLHKLFKAQIYFLRRVAIIGQKNE